MVNKFKLFSIFACLAMIFGMMGCSNLIEDLKDKENPAPVVPVPAAEDPYLTFKGNGVFNLGCEKNKNKVPGSWDGTVEYSTDKTNWTEWNGSAPIPAVEANGNYFIYLRGKNTTFSKSIMEVTGLLIYGSATEVECTGNIMTLLDWENPSSVTMGERCFNSLFSYCTKLTKAPDLPATTLSVGCYCGMFLGCTSLTTAPELPATTLANNCYDSMFQDCTSLTEAPELSVENLSDNCYRYMFYNCTSLVNTPDLPAAELTDCCYEYMFSGCTGLKSIGKIGKGNTVNVAAESAMDNMFKGCTELKIIETTVTDEDRFISIGSITGTNAVNNMFNNCASGSVTEPVAGKSYKIETPYLTFKGNGAFSLGCKIVDGDGLNFAPGWNGDLYYSTDKSTWTEWNGNTAIPAVASNGSYYIYLKGKNNTSFADLTDFKFTNFTLTGAATSVECNGNIMTLLNWESPETAAMDMYCFAYLFQYCNKLTKAPELPATDLSVNSPMACYAGMFGGCSSLLSAPELPATTLFAFCYTSMFEGCSSLTSAPVLPALTMETACYDSMFKGCSSLVTAPVLPATDLNEECYKEMFMNCTSLTSAPVLAVTKLEDDCYCQMFEGCTSLESSPALPATVLKTGSYDRMFRGCTSLTSVGKISATSIGTENASMKEMFKGCSKLNIVETTDLTEAFITIPNDITTGIENFDYMFTGCKEGSVVTPEAGKSYKVDKPFVASNYLTFEGNDTFTLGINGTAGGSKAWDGKVYYSTDKTTWTEWNKTDDSTIASSAVSGGKTYVYLAGTGNTHFAILDSDSNLKSTIFSLEGAATGVACSGNIMSLLDCENVNTVTMGDLSFACLFNGCTKLTKAPDLPATTLSMGCYYEMFKDCTSLETAPVLNAGTLTDSCYTDMFNGCTSLKTAPVLNAMSLGDYCYWGMFSGCTSLTASPALPASVLAEACYREMFRGCTSLTSPGKITATQSDKDFVMYEMFIDCSSLKVVEAESGEESFFTFTDYGGMWTVGSMFEGCATGSVEAPTPGKSYKYVIE